MSEKPVAHIVTHEGTTFIRIPEYNTILGVKKLIIKVGVELDIDGKPKKNPDGTVRFLVHSKTDVQPYSNEEYNAIISLYDKAGMQ